MAQTGFSESAETVGPNGGFGKHHLRLTSPKRIWKNKTDLHQEQENEKIGKKMNKRKDGEDEKEAKKTKDKKRNGVTFASKKNVEDPWAFLWLFFLLLLRSWKRRLKSQKLRKG